MKLKHIFLSWGCIVAMMATSCSDELSGSDWAPGEPSNTPGVYFSTDNDTYITVMMDGQSVPTATLKLKRLDTSAELSVPIEVKQATEGVQIPSSVTFASGVAEAELLLNCENAPTVKELALSLEIPEQFVNPYAAGASTFEATLLVSGWVNVSETGLTDFLLYNWSYKDAGYEPIQSKMFHLLGSNRYRVDNFLNTGIDFAFELMQSPYKDNYMRIMPLGNQAILSEYGYGDYGYYNAWWLVTDKFWEYDDEEEDEEEGDDEEWEYDESVYPLVRFTKTSTGNEDVIYWIQFMWYDDPTNAEYSYVINGSDGARTAYMSFYGNTDPDMTLWYSYSRLRFAWTEAVQDEEAQD